MRVGRDQSQADEERRALYVTVGNPIKLSASPTTITPSPLLGQHRAEILRELGYGDAEIDALAEDGAI